MLYLTIFLVTMQVTIIIPTYKRLDYLSQAIDSLLEQTYHDFTCVVVNDYPPDASAIESLLTEINDPRISLINHEISQGGNVARNTGIKRAKGDIIAFLDDDDLWFPNKLEKHVNRHQKNPQAGLVFSGVIQRWDEIGLPPKTTLAALPTNSVLEAMSRGTFCPHSTSGVTVLRQCFTQCGMFDENLISFQDWDMWYRIARLYPFDYINEPLFIFRQHLGDRTSQSVERRLQGLSQIMAKWESQLTNPEQFKNIFTKEVYITHINKLILQKNRKNAIAFWQKLLQLSQNKKDFLQATKLALLFIFGLDIYKPVLQGARYLGKNRKLE